MVTVVYICTIGDLSESTGEHKCHRCAVIYLLRRCQRRISQHLYPFRFALCHCCEGLHIVQRRIICFFLASLPPLTLICAPPTPRPSSLLLPLSAWPVVAMPPHHTVIVWSSMATAIRVCRLKGDCLYAICKLLFSHWVKGLLTLNEPKNANNIDTQLSWVIIQYI